MMSSCRSLEPEVRFGPAGWSYPDWQGPIYGGERRRGLELLATVFDVVEVNSTFYRAPTPALARGWVRKVSQNPAFLFTAKLWQGFTHEREYRASEVSGFRAGIAPLVEAGRLGALLAQFPWSFKNNKSAWEHLGRLFRAFPERPLVVEVRHATWDRPEVLASLQAENVGFCNIDQPLFAGSLGPTGHVSGETAYVRLHGRNAAAWFREDAGRDERYHYRYHHAELVPWAERLHAIATRARRVFVVTNNHFQGNAVVDAVRLRYLFDRVSPSLPAEWIASFPSLGAIARPRAGIQPDLFDRG